MTNSIMTFVLLALVTVGCQRASQPLAPSAVSAVVEADARKPGPTGGAVTLRARSWTEDLVPQYVVFRNDGSGNLYADIPAAPGVWGYGFAPSPSRTLSGTLSLTFSLQVVSGAPVVEPAEPCGTPGATIRPFLFAYRDSWSGEFARWWSNPDAVVMAPGDYTLSVPLTPDRWSSVFGKRGTDAPTAFADALRNVSSLGVSLGSPCFFGHGVWSTGGTLRWVLTSYVVG